MNVDMDIYLIYYVNTSSSKFCVASRRKACADRSCAANEMFSRKTHDYCRNRRSGGETFFAKYLIILISRDSPVCP